MKKIISTVLVFMSLFMVCNIAMSCNRDGSETKPEVKLPEAPIKGTYVWKFTIPSMGEQTSIHTFEGNIIKYKMEGKVYTVLYDMKIESYDDKSKKIIAKGISGTKEGRYFVMFLKDITLNTVYLYKAEVESLEKAKTFPLPNADDEHNHGWNLYKKL
ncbi:hypothetical protein [Riemerella columbina]|uniref:hypothetical protein n=1 Tax=Riemerella columbina TaxID=103810 RepID=UPI00036B81ED|nr:hypothetical protein [Riemerella columbina]